MADDAGPLLARAGLIENEQLLQARRAQASHGGTLGEHLVLAGFIEDEALTSFYRSRLMVPRVDPRQLAHIPPRVIARIPKDMAAEFRLVPVAIDREQNLVLAMSDPSNTHAVDEITFFTGAYVVRAVANQREIAEALARYYDIQTPLLAPAPAAAPAPGPGAPAPAAPDARHNVLPPMSHPPESSGRAVRISEIVPAVRAAKEAEARALSSGRMQAQATPAVSSPDARTVVPGEQAAPTIPANHERRTVEAEPPLRFDPEQDTRPIARAMDLVPHERVSSEAAITTAGEISTAAGETRQSERLDAVIVDEQLTPPSEPAVLLTRRRTSEQPPAQASPAPAAEDDVVLLSKRKTARARRPSATRQGLGVVDADAAPSTNAPIDDGTARPDELAAAPPTADALAATQQMRAISGEPPEPEPPTMAEARDAKTARLPSISVELPVEETGPVARAAEAERTGRFERPQQIAELDDDWGEPGSTIPPQYIGAAYDYEEPGSPLGIPVPDVVAAPPRAADDAAEHDASARRLALAIEALGNAPSRDEVITILVEHLALYCSRAAFFALTKGTLRGWSARGKGVTASDAAALSLDKPSTFQDIVATRLPFHGPVHDSRTRDFLMAAVGATPTDMTALPVCVRDKVIGIVYGDERKRQLFDDHLTSLVHSAGAALERIVMARKNTRMGR